MNNNGIIVAVIIVLLVLVSGMLFCPAWRRITKRGKASCHYREHFTSNNEGGQQHWKPKCKSDSNNEQQS